MNDTVVVRLAADVEGREVRVAPSTWHRRAPLDLSRGVDQHPHTGRTAGCPPRSVHPLGLIGVAPPSFEVAFSTAFQLSPGLGDAEVVNRDVLGHGEAVVGLDATEVVDAGDAGPREGVSGRPRREGRPYSSLALRCVFALRRGTPSCDPTPG